MFGDMFDEGDDGGIAALFATTTEQIPVPPSPRNQSGLAGIKNAGSTCFLNSALQVLVFTPEFRSDFFRISGKELGVGLAKDNSKVRQVPLQIQRLFAMLMLEKQQAISSKDVTDSFGWTEAELCQQHDAQELYQILLDAISLSLKGTAGETIVDRHFHGSAVNRVTCKQCHNFSENEVEFLDLFVPVEGFCKGLEESLHQMYCIPEVMAGDNQYCCDSCQAHVDAERTTKLRNLPPVLKMTLLRFSYDPKTYDRYKVTSAFPFPVELDMSGYTEKDGRSQSSLYELYAVVIHGGSARGGHYTVCIRDIDNLGSWEHPNSGKVQTQVVSGGKLDTIETPQEAVAHILSQQPGRAMSIDKLSAEYMKLTGVSWARACKRKYGSFPKFVKDNGFIFRLEDNMVTLVEDAMVTLASSSGGSGDSSTVQSAEGGPINGCHSVGDNAKGGVTIPPLGRRWFFFNDSSVTSMLEEDLKKEFSGKKSAYLLFYRRKDLSRPPEAKGNLSYAIPEYLVKEMEEKNKLLEKEREEYAERKAEEERKAREVTVEVHFHWDYTVHKGALQPVNTATITTTNASVKDSVTGNTVTHTAENSVTNATSSTVNTAVSRLTAERSHTLSQLFDAITELGGEKLGNSAFHIHRMRCLNDKFHLYDELKDREKTLTELAFEKETMLFVWNGVQVGGRSIPTGLESEPVSLNLKNSKTQDALIFTFPRNMPLEQFRYQISALSLIPIDKLWIQFPNTVAVETRENMSNQTLTLASLHLSDGACVLVGCGKPPEAVGITTVNSSSCDVDMYEDAAESQTQDVQEDERISLLIENRCETQEQPFPKLQLELDKDMTMGQVKQLLMATYCISCQAAVLRENNPITGLQLPYNEDLTVGSAGIGPDTCLVLDIQQMTLYFKLWPRPVVDCEALRAVVGEDWSVERCLQLMAETAGIHDYREWHLRKTNFFGDADAILDDLDLTLTQCGVQPDSLLVLQQGRLVPKGFVSLGVWLFPSPNQWDSCLLPYITTDLTALQITRSRVSVCTSPHQSVQLGDVVVSKTATLDHLRSQLLSLLAARCSLEVEATQLRVSVLDGRCQRPCRVLRGANTTLQRLKVNGKCPLGLQIVDNDAEPRDREVVLNVTVRNSNTQSYAPHQELVWNASSDPTAGGLRKHIASQLAVDSDSLVIAKHFPDEFLWRVLTDNPEENQGNGNNKKKGKKSSAASICQKPFNIHDGDVIGVLCLPPPSPDQSDSPVPSPSSEDFSTAEDYAGRQQLRQREQQKQLEREAKNLLNGLSTEIFRRPEVPLRIKIGDFT